MLVHAHRSSLDTGVRRSVPLDVVSTLRVQIHIDSFRLKNRHPVFLNHLFTNDTFFVLLRHNRSSELHGEHLCVAFPRRTTIISTIAATTTTATFVFCESFHKSCHKSCHTFTPFRYNSPTLVQPNTFRCTVSKDYSFYTDTPHSRFGTAVHHHSHSSSGYHSTTRTSS